jgi:hypothetical protein
MYAALLSLGAVVVVLHASTLRGFAQIDNRSVDVHVCNKGTVPVQPVVASARWNLQDKSLSGHWEIIGDTLRPGQCDEVFSSVLILPELFIGFGFKNARGAFTSGVAYEIPDWGVAPHSSMLSLLLDKAAGKPTDKALSRSEVSVCVGADSTSYKSKDDTFPQDDSCKDFSVLSDSRNRGPYHPLTLGLHFFPTPQTCRPGRYGENVCTGGDYYLNIAADPTTGRVTLREGSANGTDAPPPDPRITAMENAVRQAFFDGVRKAMEQAAEDEKKRKAAEDPMAKAEAARKVFEERQSKIDYNAEHERNLGRIREVAKFSPDWVRSATPLYVRGTVSRVELPTGRQPWARFYFRESPDGAFVACVYAALFSNLQQYVGKQVEVRGMLGQGRCGARTDIQVNNPSMMYDLSKGTPPDEAILPGMKNASGNAPSGSSAAIPIATRIRVSLTSNIDVLHAPNGATFQGQLAAAVTLPDGVIPQGAAVTMSHSAFARLGMDSVTANGKIWRVSARIDPASGADVNANTLSAGTTLVFVVAGTDRAVPVGR